MKKLLFSVTAKDVEFQFFRGPGKGGQKRNKTSNCARCIHPLSGAVGESRDGRSQLHNKQEAFRKMANSFTFRKWVHMRCEEIKTGQTIEEWVDDQMKPENLRIEVKENGKWVPECSYCNGTKKLAAHPAGICPYCEPV